ncbi:hypothetical protein EYB45_00785 [Erythrobacteraceae bacterium CFH 75059]|uniref:hypothetical protein n=1 Tax=Qipengyuania thermophila TaxID=2509361 RepID=UPI00101EADE6|nr:hypothetical protein [Qipengyuania thermophila]TCD06306.1 hypothetical protein EYB45_00785 [Erythrobacteraceae bacterium CFH 75059]
MRTDGRRTARLWLLLRVAQADVHAARQAAVAAADRHAGLEESAERLAVAASLEMPRRGGAELLVQRLAFGSHVTAARRQLAAVTNTAERHAAAARQDLAVRERRRERLTRAAHAARAADHARHLREQEHLALLLQRRPQAR